MGERYVQLFPKKDEVGAGAPGQKGPLLSVLSLRSAALPLLVHHSHTAQPSDRGDLSEALGPW